MRSISIDFLHPLLCHLSLWQSTPWYFLAYKHTIFPLKNIWRYLPLATLDWCHSWLIFTYLTQTCLSQLQHFISVCFCLSSAHRLTAVVRPVVLVTWFTESFFPCLPRLFFLAVSSFVSFLLFGRFPLLCFVSGFYPWIIWWGKTFSSCLIQCSEKFPGQYQDFFR